jgi:hypothetical protein
VQHRFWKYLVSLHCNPQDCGHCQLWAFIAAASSCRFSLLCNFFVFKHPSLVWLCYCHLQPSPCFSYCPCSHSWLRLPLSFKGIMAFSSCSSFCQREVELPELHQPPLICWGSQKLVKSGVFHHLEQGPFASGIVAHVPHCNCIFTCATLWLLHYDCSCAMHSNMTSLAHWHFMSCAIPVVSLKPTDIHILMIISQRLPYWQLWHLDWSYILHCHLSRFQRLYTMVLWIASVSALPAISFPGSWSWEALSTGDQVLKTRNLACFWSSWAASEAQVGFQIYPASLHLWIGGTGIHEN